MNMPEIQGHRFAPISAALLLALSQTGRVKTIEDERNALALARRYLASWLEKQFFKLALTTYAADSILRARVLLNAEKLLDVESVLDGCQYELSDHGKAVARQLRAFMPAPLTPSGMRHFETQHKGRPFVAR